MEMSDMPPCVAVQAVPAEQLVQVLKGLKQPRQREGGEAQAWVAPLGGGRAAGAVLWPVGEQGHCWLDLDAAAREAGASDALLAALLEGARAQGIVRLRLQEMLSAPLAEWLGQRGFCRWNRCYEFSYRLDEVAARLAPVWAATKGRVPAGVELLSLREAHARGLMGQMLRLEAEALGRGAALQLAQVARALDQGADSDLGDADFSLTLLHEGVVIGLTRTQLDLGRNQWVSIAMAVAPPYRAGWANLYLRIEALRRKIEDGRCLDGRYYLSLIHISEPTRHG